LFEVKLKVSNEFTEDSMLRSEYLHVHFPIEADFSADVYEIPAGNEIQFMDESSGEPTSWLWEFEGGTPQTSEEQNPKVKYLSPGNYEVKLYAINDVTSDIEVKNSLITVNELGLAEITFEVTEHDFGDVKQGEILSHIFKLENTGDQPLLISNVLTTCGCMTVEWPKDPVPPGEKGEIIVTFDTAGKAGAQNKVIRFIANTEPLHWWMERILVKANVLTE
jgi:PKD repeat protein